MKKIVPFPIVYELQATSTGVCITCTFLDSSATDCVAVVHQQISQLSSSGLMNIESGHKLTRSGDTAYGCIEGVNLEQYQIGVINGEKIESNIESTGMVMNIIYVNLNGIHNLVVNIGKSVQAIVGAGMWIA